MAWLKSLFDPANLLALLGVVVTIGVMGYERLIPGRKRIGFRVQMDTVIDARDLADGTRRQRLAMLESNPGLEGSSLVLLRIENDGFRGIDSDDYFTAPQHNHGLTVVFRDRTVHDVAVTEPSHESLLNHLPRYGPADGSQAPADVDPENPGVVWEGATIRLPRVPMNPGDHYKLLVHLTGPDDGATRVESSVGARVEGRIREGKIRDNDKFRRPSNRMLGLITALFVLVVAQPFVVQLLDRPLPRQCAAGSITVAGSTAFAPVMQQIGAAYTDSCDGRPEIRTSEFDDSADGVSRLLGQDPGAPDIAMSDGQTKSTNPHLRSQLVAVTVFALVANKDVPVSSVTSDDVRRLYRGAVLDWNDLGPHHGTGSRNVVLVGRITTSGTRHTFEDRVLHRTEGVPTTDANSCDVLNHPEHDRVRRCEVTGTPDMLHTVATTPGAIGYAELNQAVAKARKGQLKLLGLDGAKPDISQVKDGVYPFTEEVRKQTYDFWAGEFAYTYARSGVQPNSLQEWFLDYMSSRSSLDIIDGHGALPCYPHPGPEPSANQLACENALTAPKTTPAGRT